MDIVKLLGLWLGKLWPSAEKQINIICDNNAVNLLWRKYDVPDVFNEHVDSAPD